MTPMTVLGAAAAVISAVVLTSAATNVTPHKGESPANPAANPVVGPAVQIDVLEIMGRALGELPVEQASSN